MDKAIAALAGQNVIMSRNTLCRKVSRAFKSDPIEDGPLPNKKAKPSPDKEVPKDSPPSNEQATPSSVKAVPSRVVVSNQGSPSSTSTLTDTFEVEQPTRTSGRPKGSTLENKRKEEENYKACVDSITVEFSNKLTAAKLTEKRLPKGWLAALILRKKEEFSVIRPIKESKIRHRVLSGKSLTPKHRGALSPMAMAELPIVAICLQMGQVRQPVNVGEALVLANDLIKKTEHQDAVAEFQKSRHLGNLEFEHGTLTKNWWLGFLR